MTLTLRAILENPPQQFPRETPQLRSPQIGIVGGNGLGTEDWTTFRGHSTPTPPLFDTGARAPVGSRSPAPYEKQHRGADDREPPGWNRGEGSG